MEYEVTSGTGKNGQVAGYRIGGKTGTADKVGGGVIVSFVCFAPADDPQVMMLLTLDEPSKWTGTYVSGGNMVAPVASSVMGEILPYLGIEPSYTAEELVGADKTVPNVVGLSKDAAAERLSANGFSFRTVGSGDTVTDQTPAGGAIVPNSAEIILYLGAEKSTDKCIVPNVVGDSAATANQKIVNAGLIMGVSGADERKLVHGARHLAEHRRGHGGRGAVRSCASSSATARCATKDSKTQFRKEFFKRSYLSLFPH